jgi:5S rRNA maturation endonuclease (ribonuclease M5)
MLLSDKLRRIEDEIKNTDETIIVEGKKDKAALESLGFKKILDISGKSFETIAEKLKNEKSASIMADFDREGNKKSSQLITFLSKSGIIAGTSLRKKIKSLFNIQKIEELSQITKFTKLMEDDHHGKTCSIYDKVFDRSRIHNRRNNREAGHHRGHIRPD